MTMKKKVYFHRPLRLGRLVECHAAELAETRHSRAIAMIRYNIQSMPTLSSSSYIAPHQRSQLFSWNVAAPLVQLLLLMIMSWPSPSWLSWLVDSVDFDVFRFALKLKRQHTKHKTFLNRFFQVMLLSWFIPLSNARSPFFSLSLSRLCYSIQAGTTARKTSPHPLNVRRRRPRNNLNFAITGSI